MSMEKEAEKPVTQGDYQYLTRRLDRLEQTMYDQYARLSKRIRLLVRILVDKKIVGTELAKSVEETLAEGEDLEKVLDWFLKSLEEEPKKE